MKPVLPVLVSKCAFPVPPRPLMCMSSTKRTLKNNKWQSINVRNSLLKWAVRLCQWQGWWFFSPLSQLHLNCETRGDRRPHKGRHSSVYVCVADAHSSYSTAEATANRMRERPWADVSWKKKKRNTNCPGWIESPQLTGTFSALNSEGPVFEDSTPVFLSSTRFNY